VLLLLWTVRSRGDGVVAGAVVVVVVVPVPVSVSVPVSIDVDIVERVGTFPFVATIVRSFFIVVSVVSMVKAPFATAVELLKVG
jgi:hypothetical protein